MDTWTVRSDVASWRVLVSGAPASRERGDLDAFTAEITERSLLVLHPFARPWRATLNACHDDPEPVRAMEWRPGESVAAFVSQIAAAIRGSSSAVLSLEIDLDLHAFCRTPASPVRPVRVWLRLPTLLTVRAPSEEDGVLEAASLLLAFDHTLFQLWQTPEEPNDELHALNQPLLEGALRDLEGAIGAVEVSRGHQAFRYGFESTPDE